MLASNLANRWLSICSSMQSGYIGMLITWHSRYRLGIKTTPKYSTDRRYVYLFVYFLHLYLKQASKATSDIHHVFLGRWESMCSWNAVACCFGGVLELFIRVTVAYCSFFHILGSTTDKTRPDYEFRDAAVPLCLGKTIRLITRHCLRAVIMPLITSAKSY